MKVTAEEHPKLDYEAGASLLEYALLVAFLGAVIIAAMTRFQENVIKQYSVISDTL